MSSSLVPWIDALVSATIRVSVLLLVVVNGVFVAGILRSRSRTFVDRWTGTVILADAALMLALIGAPVASAGIGLVIRGWHALVEAPQTAITTPKQ
ncbi:MAG: hypothetical protein SFU57_13020 [Gemmatimonadales bacterium]|nr:hypothetical protein [Gemmatimonadales bacterium]